MGHGKTSLAELASNPASRKWKTTDVKGNAHFISKRNEESSASMPMHTPTKTKIYVSRHKDGNVKEISIMNPKTGKKIMEIHTAPHEGLKEHVHHWVPGKYPQNAQALTAGQRKFLEKIRDDAKTAKR